MKNYFKTIILLFVILVVLFSALVFVKAYTINDPVYINAGISALQAKTGEPITLTVRGQDDNGLRQIGAFYKGEWHWQYLPVSGSTKDSTKQWTIIEDSPGQYTYKAIVIGSWEYGLFEVSTVAEFKVNVWEIPSPGCTSECSIGQEALTTRCFGNYRKTCGNYDEDVCSEWGKEVDCGSDYCEDWYYFCHNSNVYRMRKCHDKGCSNNLCLDGKSYYIGPDPESAADCQKKNCFDNTYYTEGELVKDCAFKMSYEPWESNYGKNCDPWSSNYCKGNKVYHSRTCYNQGCLMALGPSCYKTVYTEEKMVENCSTGIIGKICSNGICNFSCTNECLSVGQVQCFDNTHKQTCGDYDNDSCLGWSYPESSQADNVDCGYGKCNSNQIPTDWYCSNGICDNNSCINELRCMENVGVPIIADNLRDPYLPKSVAPHKETGETVRRCWTSSQEGSGCDSSHKGITIEKSLQGFRGRSNLISYDVSCSDTLFNWKVSDDITWSFFNISPGQYDLYATWPGTKFIKTQNSYYVYQKTDQKEQNILLERVTVDQREEPKGPVFMGRPWQRLGKITVSDSKFSVKVVLSMPESCGKGFLGVSDAVMLVPLAPFAGESISFSRGKPLPKKHVIVDYGSPDYSICWQYGEEACSQFGYKNGADVMLTRLWGGGQARFKFIDFEPGRYEVYITWPEYLNEYLSLITYAIDPPYPPAEDKLYDLAYELYDERFSNVLSGTFHPVVLATESENVVWWEDTPWKKLGEAELSGGYAHFDLLRAALPEEWYGVVTNEQFHGPPYHKIPLPADAVLLVWKSKPSCTEECSFIGQFQCIDKTKGQRCVDYDPDVCLEWALTLCPYGCENGACLPECSDECSSGAMRCSDTSHKQTCGNYDSDVCSEWGGDVDCGSDYCETWENYCYNYDAYRKRTCHDKGCSNNACFDNTYPEQEFFKDCGETSCEPWGSNYCKDNSVYHSSACYERGCSDNTCFVNTKTKEEKIQDCPADTLCSNGNCETTCTNDCWSEGATQCSDDKNIQICGKEYDTDRCLEWSPSRPCANSQNSHCGYGWCLFNQKPNWYCREGNCNYSCLNDETCSNCHLPFSLWQPGYCSFSCKCDAGEGPCLNDIDCHTGYCARSVGSKYGKASTMNVCEAKYLCSDTDSGEDYYHKGITSGAVETIQVQMTDECQSDGMTLKEYYCFEDEVKAKSYQCPFGCEDGACQQSKLIALYSFEGNANDNTGNHNGTIKGNPQFVAGISGQGLQFDGIDDYIKIGTKLADINTYGGAEGKITFSAWVKPDNVNKFNMIVQGTGFRYLSAGSSGAERYLGKIRAMVRNFANPASPVNYWPISNSKINSNQWTHIVFVFEGGIGYKIYINGQLDNEVAEPNIKLYPYLTSASLGLGTSPETYFKGIIDEVKIWNYPLSDKEIKDEYLSNSGLAAKREQLLASIFDSIFELISKLISELTKKLFGR